MWTAHDMCNGQMAWPTGQDSSRSHSHRCSLILPQDHDLNYVMCILVFVCCIWVIGVYLFACCCILNAHACTRVSKIITFDPSFVLLPQNMVCCGLVGKLSLTNLVWERWQERTLSAICFPDAGVFEYFRQCFRELLGSIILLHAWLGG